MHPCAPGVRMCTHARHPDGFEGLFHAFNLRTLEEEMARAGRNGVGSRKGSGGGLASAGRLQQLRHVWVQSPDMGLQEFDVEALRAAWHHIVEQGRCWCTTPSCGTRRKS